MALADKKGCAKTSKLETAVFTKTPFACFHKDLKTNLNHNSALNSQRFLARRCLTKKLHNSVVEKFITKCIGRSIRLTCQRKNLSRVYLLQTLQSNIMTPVACWVAQNTQHKTNRSMQARFYEQASLSQTCLAPPDQAA